MSPWAKKRKNTIILIFCLIILFALLFFLWPFFQKKPTCFDGIKNGNEEGIDCGGDCEKICFFQISTLKVKRVVYQEISSNFYSLLAFVENPNQGAGVKKIYYRFDIFDKDNLLLASRTGETYLVPGNNVIFELPLEIKDQKPYRVTFSFVGKEEFFKINKKFEKPILILRDKEIENTFGTKIKATFENISNINLKDIEFIALIYDQEGNIINFSRSLVRGFLGKESKNIYFTWPYKIKNIFNFDIVVRFNFFEN